MSITPPPPSALPDQLEPLSLSGRRAIPSLYVALVVAALSVAGGWGLRHDGIFACQAAGYGGGRYLALCDTRSYGDYDHGAFWFGLEPTALAQAEDADVLFLGNSRMQLALSTPVTEQWFGEARVPYYLLGFSHSENVRFFQPLLERLRPRAKVYVVNVDRLFAPDMTDPARVVMTESGMRARYEQKRKWQRLHRWVCTRAPFVCGDTHAFFRSPETGTWVVAGGELRPRPVNYVETVDPQLLATVVAGGRVFLPRLPAPSHCILLTMVPTKDTPVGTARALADSLGLPFVAPTPDGLATFDESHLDRPSAQRWSAAFFDAAGPMIRRCLVEASGLAPAP